ncbi:MULTISPECIES: DUF4169 family protein [unclassified Sphingomonas]|uniref:DUF4169 family protein n=1 Tax=unclassified Sphingomonas TaxID=196159 RepID=UPI001D0FF081|nr:DUF4169 family protein [Sphingomonas sp. IC4-52]MCC2981438.1 DUF4169 family protein [Sphingomonas sp. IC4-52]MCD2317535.1 DUF4169 family protein [Sphingomonas sp. IC-11]
MGEVINLRRARKARARADAQDKAAANRLAFGRTKAEREAAVAEAARHDRLLDGVKRED